MKINLITITLILLCSCSKMDNQVFQIKFEMGNDPVVGDSIYLEEMGIGQVTSIEQSEDQGIITTVQIRNNVTINQGAQFILQKTLLGRQYIVLELTENQNLMDPEKLIIGQTRINVIDIAEIKNLSKNQLDSLIEMHPDFELIDSLIFSQSN